jgi:hypothetical protein
LADEQVGEEIVGRLLALGAMREEHRGILEPVAVEVAERRAIGGEPSR